MQSHTAKYTALVKATAAQLGFSYCGISKATPLHNEAPKLEKWLKQNRHGSMQYMERYFDQRINPRLLVDDAKSVITLLCNYFPQQKQNEGAPKIAKYAYGTDYHFVIKEKLRQFLYELQQQIGSINGRGFVDSAPVLERAWAVKSGLGWVGKNGNLITKKNGSFFFIATLIVDVELESDPPFVKDYCGTCTACIDACPTQAILPNKDIDAQKCISYYTIELKEQVVNQGITQQFDNWLFGCDVCQDVCPWNRFSTPHQEPKFQALEQILTFNIKDWQEISKEAFNKVFKNSPLKRSKYEGLQRNLLWLVNKEIN